MRAFEDISKDLNNAMMDVISKKKDFEDTVARADKMIAEANEMKSYADVEYRKAQGSVLDLRKEYDELMNSVVPSVDPRVRQSP